jgi:Uma2 family endonuclease
MTAYTINLNPVIRMTDEQFYELCRANPDVKFERNARGDLLIMAPTGGETGQSNANLTADFVIWNRKSQLGSVFDSSTGFKLPNGANRSPDVAWVRRDRWDALTPDQRKRFPPIAPDFVLELMSPTDTLQETQAKMREYIENGVKLGWLLNAETKRVEIYRPSEDVEILDAPKTLSGEDVLPEFTLNLDSIW